VNDCGLVTILVLRFVIDEACMYSLSLCREVRAQFILDCLSLCEGRRHAMVNSYQPPPRSMRSITLLRGLINFCNKYMSSL